MIKRQTFNIFFINYFFTKIRIINQVVNFSGKNHIAFFTDIFEA